MTDPRNAIAPDGPFKTEISVMLVGKAGKYEGYDAHATVSLPPGTVPDDATIIQAIKNALKEAGDDFRLATRQEFAGALMQERVGVKVAVAIGQNDFRLSERLK